MRRGIMGAAAAWLVLLCCLCPARASGEVFSAQSEALDLEGLVDAAEGVLPDLDLTEGVDLDQGIQYILDTGSGQMVGIAILTRVTAEVCRDAGEGGIAAFAETAGAAMALSVAVPLLRAVLETVTGLLW